MDYCQILPWLLVCGVHPRTHYAGQGRRLRFDLVLLQFFEGFQGANFIDESGGNVVMAHAVLAWSKTTEIRELGSLDPVHFV